MTREEIKELHKEKARLETRLRRIKNGDEYKKIRHAAEEEVTNSLSKRKDLLKLAVSSVIESIMRDPTKYNLLVSSLYNGRQYTSSQPCIDAYRGLILDEAHRIFELMVKDLTCTIVHNTRSTITP